MENMLGEMKVVELGAVLDAINLKGEVVELRTAISKGIEPALSRQDRELTEIRTALKDFRDSISAMQVKVAVIVATAAAGGTTLAQVLFK